MCEWGGGGRFGKKIFACTCFRVNRILFISLIMFEAHVNSFPRNSFTHQTKPSGQPHIR